MDEGVKKRLKQERPFATKQESAFLSVLLLAQELHTEFNELFKPSDLTLAQYNVLRILRGAGQQGHACGQIAERMITREPDITRMLDRLERSELIRRERQQDDRRVVLTFLTDKGAELLKELDRPVDELHRKQLDGLTEAELDRLIELLEKARRRAK
jgi:DNA-binding MarR family transcriptional regulator